MDYTINIITLVFSLAAYGFICYTMGKYMAKKKQNKQQEHIPPIIE